MAIVFGSTAGGVVLLYDLVVTGSTSRHRFLAAVEHPGHPASQAHQQEHAPQTGHMVALVLHFEQTVAIGTSDDPLGYLREGRGLEYPGLSGRVGVRGGDFVAAFIGGGCLLLQHFLFQQSTTLNHYHIFVLIIIICVSHVIKFITLGPRISFSRHRTSPLNLP